MPRFEGYRDQHDLRCCYNCKYCESVEYEENTFVCHHPLHKDELVEVTGICAYIVGVVQ